MKDYAITIYNNNGEKMENITVNTIQELVHLYVINRGHCECFEIDSNGNYYPMPKTHVMG